FLCWAVLMNINIWILHWCGILVIPIKYTCLWIIHWLNIPVGIIPIQYFYCFWIDDNCSRLFIYLPSLINCNGLSHNFFRKPSIETLWVDGHITSIKLD